MVPDFEEFIAAIYHLVHLGAWWSTIPQTYHLVSSPETPSPCALWLVRVILCWLPENSSFPRIFYHRRLWGITPILIPATPEHVAISLPSLMLALHALLHVGPVSSALLQAHYVLIAPCIVLPTLHPSPASMQLRWIKLNWATWKCAIFS